MQSSASFIPTIGTLIAMAFPPLAALVQFGELGPFFIALVTIAPIQLFASNYLEPKMLSKSMNLSALATLVAIFLGGAVWGILGALIVVPVLAVFLIVCERFPNMRPIAVLLSEDGDVRPKSAGEAKPAED